MHTLLADFPRNDGGHGTRGRGGGLGGVANIRINLFIKLTIFTSNFHSFSGPSAPQKRQ